MITGNISKWFMFCLSMILIVGFSCSKEIILSQYVDSPGNTTYYIDSESGNNESSGTSESQSWKNFDKVNVTTFQPGDKILLKRGGIWNGQLYPSGSGSQEAPIEIGAYGTGSAPLINANGVDSVAVHLKNQSHWIIRDLEITNKAEVRSNTYRWGILIENRNRALVSNIQILNNVIHDVTGSFHFYGTKSPHMNGGIAAVVFGSGATDKFDQIRIEGNLVYNAGRTGIVVWDQYWNGAGQASTQVVIRQNTVRDIDSDGILVYGCDGAILEHNLADKCGSYVESAENAFNGSCAIWATRGANCVVQFNEAANTKKLPGNADGQGFDVDIDGINHIVQYNYSHDNEGGFILILSAAGDPSSLVGTSGAVVRYNISQNDKSSLISFAGGIAPNTQIYNNTFYIKNGLDTKIIDYSWEMDMTKPFSFQNNIVYNLGSGGYRIPGPNGTFSNNLYYGNHPASEPEEANKLTVDPQFVNPGSGGNGRTTLDGYKLGENSPALGMGIYLPNHGGQDFYGNTISELAKPSIGAFFVYKGEAELIKQDFVDHLNDASKLYSVSANTTFDNSNPQLFEGDPVRLTRTDGTKATLVYKKDQIKAYEIKAYLFDADVTKIKVYGSSNGTSWTPISSNYGTLVETSNGWKTSLISSAANLPVNINYIKIELEDPNSWGTQIGKVTLKFDDDNQPSIQAINDDLNDASKLFDLSSNMTLDNSNPQFFDQDNSRAARSDNSKGTLVYKGVQLQSLEMKVYLFDADITKIKVYRSSNGSSWTAVQTSFSDPVATGAGWKSSTITSAADLPNGTNYLKIELEDPVGWGTQIGKIIITHE